jgi:hypothetical protein
MNSLFSLINLLLLLVICGIIIYLFIKVITLSIKLNDLKYKVEKPTIPFQNNNTFLYTDNTSGKNLL